MTEETGNVADRAQVAEILERIRRRLQEQPAVPFSAHPGSASPPPAPMAASEEPTDVLQGLLTMVEATHRQVGRINPRPPGLHNQLIQMAKRALRRMLSWYTRALREHQSASIELLSHTLAVIEHQQAQLRRLQEELRSLRAELEGREQGNPALQEVRESDLKS